MIFGAMTGWGASMLVGRKFHLFFDVATGIAGALLGGWIMTSLGFGMATTGFNMYSFVVSILGAAILIWATRAIKLR